MTMNDKKIVIYGVGGFGKEIKWLIERINETKSQPLDCWNVIGFIDDGVESGTIVDGAEVLGGAEFLLSQKEPLAVAIAIGNAKVRKKVVDKIKKNACLYYPNLIDPSAVLSNKVQMGEGNLICSGTILTVDIQMEDFNIFNLSCTIGHDVRMTSYITAYPSVNISGCVSIGELCEIGTGTQIIQGLEITPQTIIGAGAVVTKHLTKAGTYVGVPVKRKE